MEKRQVRPLEAVLFDFDGTLVDTSVVICRAFNEALVERGHLSLPEGRIRAMIGRPLRDMFLELSPAAAATEHDLEACIMAYKRLFFPIAEPLSKLMPSVRETLEFFLEAGVKLAVVTTRTADGARHILSCKGLEQAFSAVIGLEHVERPKPHPEPVLMALDQLGVRPERAVMVGDTPDDVIAGKRAGVYTVAVTTGPYDKEALCEADAVVTELRELPAVVEEIFSGG